MSNLQRPNGEPYLFRYDPIPTWWQKLLGEKDWHDEYLRRHGSACWCPNCEVDLVSGDAFRETSLSDDSGFYLSVCPICDARTAWDYATFPAPILIYPLVGFHSLP